MIDNLNFDLNGEINKTIASQIIIYTITYQFLFSFNHFSRSSAAIHPYPAAVTACL